MYSAVVIADYGKDTGAGHLMRCYSLAKELSDKFSVKFACEDDEYFPFVSELLAKDGISAVAVDEMSYVGRALGADLIIIDSYKISAKFLTDVKNFYDVCCVIDDNVTLPFYDVDFVINHNVGAENYIYKARKDTKLLLGLDYLMLRDSFLDIEPIDISSDVKNIVITLGAADVKNTTGKILNIVNKYKNYVFEVVVGPESKNSEILEEYERKYDNIVLHRNADMPKLFSKCQGAIAACGVTVYELAALGVPTIGVVTAENQQNTSIQMENKGLVVSAGLSEKLSEWYFDQLFDDVVNNTELRKSMHKKQLAATAGNGKKRIKEKILEKL